LWLRLLFTIRFLFFASVNTKLFEFFLFTGTCLSWHRHWRRSVEVWQFYLAFIAISFLSIQSLRGFLPARAVRMAVKQPPGAENHIIKQTLEIASDGQEPILAMTGFFYNVICEVK